MKDKWYADKRDLVKWATLAHLAKNEKLDVIVQVPYLRLGERGSLCRGDTVVEIEICGEVWEFFRTPKAVERLGGQLGRSIRVLDRLFEPEKRGEYLDYVVAALADIEEPKALLLDPDTGIEPSRAAPEHAAVEDVRAVWGVLRPGDWLVLYQHASRTRTWLEDRTAKLREACGNSQVEVFSGPRIAPDVVCLAVQKRPDRA